MGPLLFIAGALGAAALALRGRAASGGGVSDAGGTSGFQLKPDGSYVVTALAPAGLTSIDTTGIPNSFTRSTEPVRVAANLLSPVGTRVDRWAFTVVFRDTNPAPFTLGDLARWNEKTTFFEALWDAKGPPLFNLRTTPVLP